MIAMGHHAEPCQLSKMERFVKIVKVARVVNIKLGFMD